jgi:hypothetical protein
MKRKESLGSSIPTVAFMNDKPSATGIRPGDLLMSTHCDVIFQWSATPEQLTALGAAIWRWCSRTARATGIYQYLDNQAMADLIAGKLPSSSQSPWPRDTRGVHFCLQREASHDRQATIASLRREIPAGGIEDIVIDGKSWNLSD